MKPHLNTIAMVVTDMDATLNFYSILGLDIPLERMNELYVECVAPNETTIVFITKQNMLKLNPNWKEGSGRGNVSLHFKFENASKVEATYREMVQKGYKAVTLPHDTSWGECYAEISDPDGNIVSLFAHLTEVKHRFSVSALCAN